ncbi:hypothetical protein KJ815_07230, partial [bacterium]|nr:hypothetical protein [bacterium]
MISVRLRAVLLFSLVVGGSTAVFAISSIDFTVSQAYASTPDAATFDFPGSFAIEAWFQSNGPHDGALVSKFWQNSGSPLDDSYYLCLRTADTVQARIQTTLQLADLRAAGPIHDGEWHHVVLVFDTAAHVAELYLDGELKAWQTLLGTLRNTNESVRLGAVLDGGGLGSFLDGRLDELRFWNTARRGKQAWCLKDVTLLTGTPGLTSYYRFDEGSGSTTADLIPPYETFSLISGTVFSPVEPPLLSRLSGPGQCRCGTIAGVFTPAVPSVTLVGDTIRVLSGDSLILESHALTLDSTVTQLRIEGRFRCAGTMSDSSWVLAQGSPAAAGIVALVGSQPVTLNYTRVSGFAADAIQATTPITAEHCLFSANPGRALVTSSTATIRDSRFEGNGLAVQASGGNVTISSCNFAGDGGGLDVTGANLTVD